MFFWKLGVSENNERVNTNEKFERVIKAPGLHLIEFIRHLRSVADDTKQTIELLPLRGITVAFIIWTEIMGRERHTVEVSRRYWYYICKLRLHRK